MDRFTVFVVILTLALLLCAVVGGLIAAAEYMEAIWGERVGTVFFIILLCTILATVIALIVPEAKLHA